MIRVQRNIWNHTNSMPSKKINFVDFAVINWAKVVCIKFTLQDFEVGQFSLHKAKCIVNVA